MTQIKFKRTETGAYVGVFADGRNVEIYKPARNDWRITYSHPSTGQPVRMYAETLRDAKERASVFGA